jgi:ribonuclease P protein component
MSPKRSISFKEGFSDIFDNPDQKHSTKNILILSKDNSLGYSRIGVAIRKKENRLAVDRNNIKRKIKGSFLAKVLELPNKDFVVYVKKNLKGKEEELKKDLDKIWGKFMANND